MDRSQSEVPYHTHTSHHTPHNASSTTSEPRHGFRDPDPRSTHAYLVGGGIASLAAAAILIHDANIPATQVHILESSRLTGGSMDGAGSPETGYILRGGRMLNFTYRCLYDLLSTIPSLTDPKVTVMDEIKMFNSVQGNKTHANARIVKEPKGNADGRPRVEDSSDFGLSLHDRTNLLKVTAENENKLTKMKIQDCFSEAFFHTNFWIMWASMFAFQPWHSAVEFRRYLHRFLQELPRIDTLAGVDRTPYNQYDSIILPLTEYLIQAGIEIKYDVKVTALNYAGSKESGRITVQDIHIEEAGLTGVIHVHEKDIVLITLGSMTSSSTIGTNEIPPAVRPSPSSDGSWELWKSLSRDYPHFGNPYNFCDRVPESHWESFTVTLKSPEFFSQLKAFTHNEPGTGALVTFADSNWLMSIVVPHQPHFISQPQDVQVFWGYGLFPAREGNFVHRPMTQCSGEEIFAELLGHLGFPQKPYSSITIPCSMPYITSQFLTRGPGDRPEVIPKGSTNLAFIGQFVEIPLDVVFTVEYSVRSAMIAVYELMGLKKQPRSVYKGEHNPLVLAKVLKAMVEDGVGHKSDSSGVDTNVDLMNIVAM